MSTTVQHMPDVVHVFNNHIKSDFEKIIPNRETNVKIIWLLRDLAKVTEGCMSVQSSVSTSTMQSLQQIAQCPRKSQCWGLRHSWLTGEPNSLKVTLIITQTYRQIRFAHHLEHNPSIKTHGYNVMIYTSNMLSNGAQTQEEQMECGNIFYRIGCNSVNWILTSCQSYGFTLGRSNTATTNAYFKHLLMCKPFLKSVLQNHP